MKLVYPVVKLVQHNSPHTIACAARSSRNICYNHKYDDKDHLRLIRKLLRMGHDSTFEFFNLIFQIQWISRVASHQLVTHRHQSKIQTSLRYVKLKSENMAFVVPKGLAEEFIQLMVEHYQKSEDLYLYLVEKGVKAEDARYILPLGIASGYYIIQVNFRELMHIWNLRASRYAQQEIRDIVVQMWAECAHTFPDFMAIVKEERFQNNEYLSI